MDRDALFLLSLVAVAIAAFTVGIAGWLIWSRTRAADTAEHPAVTEES
jgi:hypothetical protein